MIELVSKGIGLGFTAGSIFGPLHTYLLNETLIAGWRRSIIIVFAPLVADLPLILLMVLVLDQLPEAVISALKVVGGLFILVLARRAWQQAKAERITLTDEDAPDMRRMTFARALLLNWLNPAPYIFWGTVNGPLLVEGLEQSLAHGLAFLIAFYGTFLGIMAVLALVFDRMRRLDERIVRGVMKVSVLVLIFFSATLILQGVGVA